MKEEKTTGLMGINKVVEEYQGMRSQRNTMNHAVPTDLVIQMKQTSSLKGAICHQSHRNRQPIPSTEIEQIITSKQEAPSQDGFTGELNQRFK